MNKPFLFLELIGFTNISTLLCDFYIYKSQNCVFSPFNKLIKLFSLVKLIYLHGQMVNFCSIFSNSFKSCLDLQRSIFDCNFIA